MDLPIILTEATKEGYEFLGWYNNPGFEGEPVTEITATGNYEFWAKFEQIIGIDAHQHSAIMLYPNPCRTFITVRSLVPVNSVRIFDITGKMVISLNGLADNNTIDIRQLKEGVYLIQIQTDTKMITTRFIKN